MYDLHLVPFRLISHHYHNLMESYNNLVQKPSMDDLLKVMAELDGIYDICFNQISVASQDMLERRMDGDNTWISYEESESRSRDSRSSQTSTNDTQVLREAEILIEDSEFFLNANCVANEVAEEDQQSLKKKVDELKKIVDLMKKERIDTENA